MPQNKEMDEDVLLAESAVVGSILLDPTSLPLALECLTEDDFLLEANKSIFRGAVALYQQGKVVDVTAIIDGSEGRVSRRYAFDLMSYTTTAANIEEYAKLTRNSSMRRSLKTLSGRMMALAGAMSEEPRDIIAEAKQELERIEAQDTSREINSSSDMMLSFYEHRKNVDSGHGGFVHTGLSNLDKTLGGGLLNSGLYVLAARPGMGKTTLAIGIAENVASRVPVMFVSLEMDEEQLAAKRLSRVCGISYNALMMGSLNEDEWGRCAEWSSRLANSPLFTNKKSQATVDDIRTIARKIKDVGLVVVDYFGLIKPSKEERSRYEAMTSISGELKSLARRLKVPILCLAQINRENTKRDNKRPQLSDLRDTGALEQDADGVIFLHCPNYYTAEHIDPWGPDPMEIIVAKNRHAETGVCNAAFYRAVGKIVAAKF